MAKCLMTQMDSVKVPICLLIGAGSKLPAIIKAAKLKDSLFRICLVVSHKAHSTGVELALKNQIPAIYFNLPDYRKRIFKNDQKARADYMQKLGWFISQKQYAPKLLVFAGWDLVMDSNFFDFFKVNFGSGYAAINLHPGIMPIKGEGKMIELPDGTKTQVIKGEIEDVLKEVLKTGVTYFGPSIHFMVADDFDTGEVIKRKFIKVEKNDNVESLHRKLILVEDRILVEAINEVINKDLI